MPPSGPQQGPAQPGWPPVPDGFGAVRPPALPVVPTHYHGFWRSPRWRVWRPVLALLVGIGGYLVLSTVLSLVALSIDAATGRVGYAEHIRQLQEGGGFTPALFILNNLSLAACIPLAWAAGAIHGQRPRWMSSVTGRFRWRWFWSCLGWLLPIWVLMTVVTTFIPAQAGEDTALHVNHDTLIMIFGVLLTTPLQCAGEEFGFRGLLNRAVASFVPQTTRTRALVSALLGGTTSSILFMFAHDAQDGWLNLFYFCFGGFCCYLGHVSGGLEASTAMHIVNNMTSMVFLPFTDFSHMMDRSDGTGSPWGLVQVVAVILGAALITWRARRRGIVSVAAPGRDGTAEGTAGPDERAMDARAAAQPWQAQGPEPQRPAVPWLQTSGAAPAQAWRPGTSGPVRPGYRPGLPPSWPGPRAQSATSRPEWQPTAPPSGEPWDAAGRSVTDSSGPDTAPSGQERAS